MISVILATYNPAATVQSLSDRELIIVDDGSADETPQILAGITDPRVATARMTGSGPTSDGWLSASEAAKCRGDYWGLTKTSLLGNLRFDERLTDRWGLWLTINRSARRYYVHRALLIIHTELTDRMTGRGSAVDLQTQGAALLIPRGGQSVFAGAQGSRPSPLPADDRPRLGSEGSTPGAEVAAKHVRHSRSAGSGEAADAEPPRGCSCGGWRGRCIIAGPIRKVLSTTRACRSA